jgi:hypothetical protein
VSKAPHSVEEQPFTTRLAELRARVDPRLLDALEALSDLVVVVYERRAVARYKADGEAKRAPPRQGAAR